MAGKLGKQTNIEKSNEFDLISTISLKCRNLPVPEVSQAAGSVIIALLACLSFVGSLGGDFVFDDNEAILNNKDVRMETKLFSIFKHDFWGANITSATSHKSYRPLTVLTFRLNYWTAGGYNAVGFHLVNIILHVFNCILSLRVFSVIFGGISVSKQGKKVFSSPRASFLASILFAVHPIHTENVAGIVGRADLLCAFFFFVSFLAYARGFSTGSRKTSSSLPEKLSWPILFICIVFATLAIFSKEQGITVLGICIVYDVLQTVAAKRSAMNTILVSGVVKDDEMPWLKTLAKRMLVLIVAIAVLLFWRMKIMGGSPPKFQEGDNPAAFASSLLFRVINYNYIYCVNLWLLLNPFWLCFDWSMGCIPLINSINDVRILAPLLFWIFMATLVWKSFSTIDSHFGRTLLMLFAFVVVPFLPSANILFTVGFVIAERNLYISSVGFIGIAVLGAVILCEADSLAKIAKFGIHFLIMLFLLRCIQRSQDWLSEERLFLSGEAVCPLNAKVHYNIGKVLSDKGETEAAMNYYRESIRLNPVYDQPLNNLGNILQKIGKPLEAEAMLKKAVSISPKFAAGWMNLGITKASLQQFKDAEQCYLNAIKNKKFYPDAFYNLGNLFLEMKVYDKAIWYYKKVIEMKPDHESSWINLILLHDEIGKSNVSLSIGKKALALLPKSASLLHAVGNLYGKADLYKEAEKLFLKAIELNPSDASYVGNLAVLYHRWKRYYEAEVLYLRSLKINPNNKVTLLNFRKLRKILGKE